MGWSERTPWISVAILAASCLASPATLSAQEEPAPPAEAPVPVESETASTSEPDPRREATPSDAIPAFEPIPPVESSNTTRLRFDELLASFELARTEFFRDAPALEPTPSGPEARRDLALDPADNPTPQFVVEFRRFAERNAGTVEAIAAWIWIFEHAGRTPRVADAASEAIDILTTGYRDHPALATAVRFAHHCGPGAETFRLLETLWTDSTVAATRAAAGYGLARLERSRAEGTPEERTARARALLVEVRERFGALPYFRDLTYAEQIDADLYELDHLAVGKPAPEIEGEDLRGEPMRLSDHRGSVVLLVFWGEWCGTCRASLPKLRALVARHRDDPFVLLGVNSDPDRAAIAALVRTKAIPGRSWFDGGTRGPIAKRWNIHRWPTLFVIDADGVIRARDLRGEVLEECLAETIAAAREDPGEE